MKYIKVCETNYSILILLEVIYNEKNITMNKSTMKKIVQLMIRNKERKIEVWFLSSLKYARLIIFYTMFTGINAFVINVIGWLSHENLT